MTKASFFCEVFCGKVALFFMPVKAVFRWQWNLVFRVKNVVDLLN